MTAPLKLREFRLLFTAQVASNVGDWLDYLALAAVVAGMIVAPNLPTLLALAFLKVTFSTFFTPAEQATIRRVVPSDQLMAANSLSQFVLQATKVIGPAL